MIYELNEARETLNNLLEKIIVALKEAHDANYQRWLSNQVVLWSMRKLDWKHDGSDLMGEAIIYYQEAIKKSHWVKRAHRRGAVCIQCYKLIN